MTTLMQWGNSEGVKGRCDAKCHNAFGPDCNCMCGGRYHGGGRDGTLQERIAQYGDEVLEAAEKRAVEEGWDLEALAGNELLAALREDRAWRCKQKAGSVPSLIDVKQRYLFGDQP